MAVSRENFAEGGYEAPRGRLENMVAEIIADILEVDRFGRTDSFYDFGGTSLQAIRICTRIEHRLNISVQPSSLFENDVLADFSADLETQAEVVGD